MSKQPVLSFEDHIILDQIFTWPKKIVELISNSKVDLQNYLIEARRIDKLAREIVEYRWNRPQNKYATKWNNLVNLIEFELQEAKIIGFHCSRLMDFEILDIIENGIEPLSLEFSNSRIRKLYKNSLISEELRDNLIDKKELSAENRVGHTFFFHCTSTLKDEMGLCRLFKSWGGEAIYLNNEKNTALQEIGIPSIVVASLERLELDEYPCLSERMICILLNDNYHPHDFDTWLNNIEPTDVISVITRNDELFEILTNIKDWNTLIE